MEQPVATSNQYALETEQVRDEIVQARELLPGVVLPDDVAALGLQLVGQLRIDSLRAEITMFEAARAYAAADGRSAVIPGDLLQVAPMALRLRRSEFIENYFVSRQPEEDEIAEVVATVLGKSV